MEEERKVQPEGKMSSQMTTAKIDSETQTDTQ